jgi:hypothetical protein
MSQKDVIKYYNEVAENYKDMLENLKDMEEEMKESLVTPEQVDQMKRMAQPVVDNYKTLSYIIFLLNRPTKKEKFNRYEKQNKKLLENCRTKEEVLNENKEALNNLKNL